MAGAVKARMGLYTRASEPGLSFGKRYVVTPSVISPESLFDLTNDFGQRVATYKAGFHLFDEDAPPPKTDDAVNHPSHYGNGPNDPYEAIKVIEAWGLNFNCGNAAKYISRAGKKTPNALEDLKKAAWYLAREIKNLEAACQK